ncbi:MAG TPA: acyltransferase [Acidimicrobiia bacterium]|nr:acyltransferase [Acidimicrobiia bacterium]
MSRERWPELDGLRGVAILLVVAAHAHVLSADVGGMVGVTLFFVLSGFLITNLLIEEIDTTGRLDLKAFYARRALRLLPALSLYLVGITLVLLVLRVGVPVIETLWPPALYASNYAQIFGMDLYAHRHTWSLAVEEHFYLAWPVLVGLGATKRLRLLGGVVVGLIGWRIVASGIDASWAYMGTDTNAFALGMGALLAATRRERILPKVPPAVATFGVVGMALLSLVQVGELRGLYEASTWVTIVASFLAAATVWAAVSSDGPTFLSARVLRWFGLISYALYLWHAPLLLLPQFGDDRFTRLLGAGLSVAIAWLSWKLVEGPIMRSGLRQRLQRGSSQVVSRKPSLADPAR